MGTSPRSPARATALATTLALIASLLVVVVGPAPAPAADRPSRVKPCSALRAQTGVTARTITLASIADVTGPVPGLHSGELRAVEAFAAYADARGIRVCGRRLVVRSYDSRTDVPADQRAYLAACRDTFAAVGSASTFDSGGAATAQACGLPDLRASSSTPQRVACTTCFAVRPSGLRPDGSRVFAASVPDRLVAAYPEETQHTATYFVDQHGNADRARAEVRAWTRRGMGIDVVQGISSSEFNYASYVSQMRSEGIEVVRLVGPVDAAVRMAQAMAQQRYAPTAYVLDTEVYGRDYLQRAGTAARTVNSLVPTDALPFEESARNADLRLYRTWLERTRPGTAPTVGGLYAWSAMRLFVQQAKALKGGLTRAALVGRLRTVKGWSDDGMHAPQPVGAERVSRCWRFLRPSGGRWVAAGSSAYLCGGLVSGD